MRRAARPGEDFDGTPLTQADFQPGAKYEIIDDNEDPAKVTLCRPGVRTMWDALLSEGRRFWFFASSDWHNRGAFGPLDYECTNDFWPGEYQEQFTYVLDHPYRDTAQQIVDGLRSGNSYAVQGQLIDQVRVLGLHEHALRVDGRDLADAAGVDGTGQHPLP